MSKCRWCDDTGWCLDDDQQCNRLCTCPKGQEEKEKLRKIREALPRLDPITLTEWGEQLGSYWGLNSWSPSNDDQELGMGSGVHLECNGFIDIKPISKLYRAIVCRSCGMRVVIPGPGLIRTYGDLRKWMERHTASVERP